VLRHKYISDLCVLREVQGEVEETVEHVCCNRISGNHQVLSQRLHTQL